MFSLWTLNQFTQNEGVLQKKVYIRIAAATCIGWGTIHHRTR